MNRLLAFFVFLFFSLIFIQPIFASTIIKQTDKYDASLNVWQVIQELGSNLNGPLGSVTFRVFTSTPNNEQFNFTAQNTRLYDKTTNTQVAAGCIPQGADPNDDFRGLIFNKINVPSGFQDVTMDFSCHNFSFISGHRYLIKITNANSPLSNGMLIHFAAAGYGQTTQDFFSDGGLRYSFDNGICDPLSYSWNSPTESSGCNIFTSVKDDLYFILSDSPPAPPPPPLKTPVIFIPGIGGTQFKTKDTVVWSKPDGHGGTFNHTYPQGEQVWVNANEAAKLGDDDYFDILRMKQNGLDSEADLELVTDNFAGVYMDTIKFFNDNGYKTGETFFMFPYDWRKDLALTAPLLDQKINEIKALTGSEKVDLVAHSMGGLVARNYIQDQTRANKVRKLVELGVPHLGSVTFLKAIRYGLCLTESGLPTEPICLGVLPSELKDVIQNMSGGFELAPSQKYFYFYSGIDNQHPFPLKDSADLDNNNVTGNLNYDQTKALLTNLGHNTSLFTPTENFHQIDNNLINTNGVSTTLIVGSGTPTLGQIIENKINVLGLNIFKKDALMVNGDDTVPLFSASLIDPDKNRSLLGSAQVFYVKQNHGNLSGNMTSLNFVKNILNGSSLIPDGISSQPFRLKGKQVSVHSPVNIEITDSNGNKTSIESDGTIRQNIPGSYFDTLDDAKFIWLPDDGTYNIKLAATDNGEFDLKIRDFKDDINDKSTLYQNIPIQNTTKAELNLDTTASQSATLKIDNDGNGTIDKQQTPTAIVNGNENSDTIPPEAQITFNPQTKGFDILGTDNLSTVSVSQQSTDYVLTDAGGNTTKLNTTAKTGSLTLNSITYKENSSTILPQNSFNVSFNIDKKTNKFKTLIQTITIKNQISLKATYDPKKDITKIEITEFKKKKVTQIKPGIILLKLNTDNGKLVTTF